MESNQKKIIMLSISAFLALMFFSLLLLPSMIMDFSILGLIILIVPYFIYRFIQFSKIKRYEKEFPNFLRAITESKKSGLDMLQAIRGASDGEYGSLTKEVKKLRNQIAWNVPVEEAFQKFANRIGSSQIKKSVLVITQANKFGGELENIMSKLATNMEDNKEVNEERKRLLGQQVTMMYAIFFIFLAISIALIKFLVPMMSQTGTESLGGLMGGFSGKSPCEPCLGSMGAECISCNIFNSIGASMNFGNPEEAGYYYKSLFFAMVIIQGFFSGLVAGQIAEDSIIAGTKHSLIMVLSGLLFFIITTRVGIV